MAIPNLIKSRSCSHKVFGVDFSMSSPVPFFERGAKVDGIFDLDLKYLVSTNDKHYYYESMEFLYALALSLPAWDTEQIIPGMFGKYSINNGTVLFDKSDPWLMSINDVMSVGYVNIGEFGWFVVLNSDPINPLNPTIL